MYGSIIHRNISDIDVGLFTYEIPVWDKVPSTGYLLEKYVCPFDGWYEILIVGPGGGSDYSLTSGSDGGGGGGMAYAIISNFRFKEFWWRLSKAGTDPYGKTSINFNDYFTITGGVDGQNTATSPSGAGGTANAFTSNLPLDTFYKISDGGNGLGHVGANGGRGGDAGNLPNIPLLRLNDTGMPGETIGSGTGGEGGRGINGGLYYSRESLYGYSFYSKAVGYGGGDGGYPQHATALNAKRTFGNNGIIMIRPIVKEDWI